jgi:4-hydroxy-2-oxoheptanedioate aldolase
VNAVRAAAADGRPAVGAWVALPSGLGAEILGQVGFDFLLLDTQHGGVTWDNMLTVLQGMAASASTALVRVGWNSPELIMRALDLGAGGVVVPMVSTPQQAAEAAAATRYPPSGNRSFGPLRRGATPARANADVLCLPMIETVDGLANLEAIVATEGVDGVFVGPMDLALSLGHLALDYTAFHPAVLDAIDEVVRVCHRHHKLAGTVSLGPSGTADMLGRGIDFLTVGADGGYLRQGAQRDLALVKSLLERDGREASGG